MKFIKIIIVLFLVLFFNLVESTSTNTATSTATSSQTASKTESTASSQMMSSIFSYDFLSVMKKKMKTRLEKENGRFAPIGKATVGAPAPAPAGAANRAAPAVTTTHNKNPLVLFSGWLKYFKFQDSISHNNKPTSFYQNNQYFHQHLKHPGFKNETMHADGGYSYIPKNTSFFGTLFKDSLTIASSRFVKYIFS